MPSQFTRNITTSFSSRMLDLVSDLITGLFKRRQTRIYLSVAPVLCTDTHGDSTRLTPAAFEPRTRLLQEEAVPKQGFSEANGIRITTGNPRYRRTELARRLRRQRQVYVHATQPVGRAGIHPTRNQGKPRHAAIGHATSSRKRRRGRGRWPEPRGTTRSLRGAGNKRQTRRRRRRSLCQHGQPERL